MDKKELAKLLKDIDICMMTTRNNNGHLHSRPMSNNQNVEWDGDSWFFSYRDSSQVEEIQADPYVNLAYSNVDDILFVSIAGEGQVTEDKDKKKELWVKDLERWFPDGPEDERVVLIKVTGVHAEYWQKEDNGKFDL